MQRAATADAERNPLQSSALEDLLSAVRAHEEAEETEDRFMNWEPSEPLRQLVETAFRRPLSKQRHRDLVETNPLPRVDALKIQQLNEFIRELAFPERPETRSRQPEITRVLPLEADLRNQWRNFVCAAGPMARLLELSAQDNVSREDIIRLSGAALRLLGHAAAYFNEMRRKAVWDLPALKPLRVVAKELKGPTGGTQLLPDLRQAYLHKTEVAKALIDHLKAQRELERLSKPSSVPSRGPPTKRRRPRSPATHDQRQRSPSPARAGPSREKGSSKPKTRFFRRGPNRAAHQKKKQ